jgi:hypothetical protein
MPPAPAPQRPTIHASGQHQVKLPPKKLRLTLSMKAEGLDAKSAIRALADHKTKVKTELLALKAEEASITFGATRLSSGIAGLPPEAARYGQQMIMQMLDSGPHGGRGGGGAAKQGEMPTVFTAVASARAEWALPTTDLDALALLPETLKEQIKQRDLVGEKNKAKFEAAMQERVEEISTAMRDRMGGYSSDNETAPFAVLFVSRMDEPTRQAATKAAFEQASAEADALAKVTTFKKGPVLSLRYNTALVPNMDEMTSNYAMQFAMAARHSTDLTGEEASGASPDDLKLVVSVEVDFALE